MLDLHCHTCGGRPSDPIRTSYRLPPAATAKAPPHRDACSCAMPIVYGPPEGYLSSPGMTRSAARRN